MALVTLDVDSMYNNMTQDLGRVACKEYLEGGRRVGDQETGDQENMNVTSESILKALDLCLSSNFFSFNDKVYQQEGGVGTGIKLAPPYACLGMGKFETMAFSSNTILLEKILLWKRFIDDVRRLFKRSKDEHDQFVSWLNSLLPGVIKFKYEFSFTRVEFLDLEIYVKDGKLETSLYTKPSNKQLYFKFKPPPTL